MAVKVSKPELNLREKISELDKPSGVAGEAMLRAETPQEQFNLIGAGRRNMIINGGFDVWQRGTSHAAGTAGGITYTTDRWWRYGGGSGTLEKSTDAPAGFANSFYVNSTSSLTIGTTVELPRLGYFPQQVMTFSMYVKGSFINNIIFNFRNVSGSGTNQVAISTQAQAGFYSDWTRLIFTVDTRGITPHANNTALNIEMGVQVGLRITGVQLEVGKVATPFEHRSYGEELALCERYYQRVPVYHESIIGQCWNTTSARFPVQLPVEMRSDPTITVPGPGTSGYSMKPLTASLSWPGGSGNNAVTTRSPRHFYVTCTGYSGLVAGNASTLYAASNYIYIKCDAEL